MLVKLVNNDCVLFGSYPQSRVDDEKVLASLAEQVKVPTADSPNGWTSYKYYENGKNDEDYAWFIDICLDKEKYRGVYFTKYRPYAANRAASESGDQAENGYSTCKLHWFIYEPIKWRVAVVENKQATLISEFALDSTEFDFSPVRCSNNYSDSKIRAWLNEGFYNTAFTDGEKAYIQTAEVDNSKDSTDDLQNPYTCKNTLDKIWLLSARDALNYYKSNDERKVLPTAYAMSQGCYISLKQQACQCWLRSPHSCSSDSVWGISPYGALDYCSANHTYPGIVPTIRVKPAQ